MDLETKLISILLAYMYKNNIKTIDLNDDDFKVSDGGLYIQNLVDGVCIKIITEAEMDLINERQENTVH